MIKKIIAISCCALMVPHAYAHPNTVTVTGKLINNITKDIIPPGWDYITTRVTLSSPDDTQNIKISGATIPVNGVYFDLYYNNPVDYVIDSSHLSGKITIEFYDPNSNYKCVWSFAKGATSGTLLSGESSTCTQSENNFYMNKHN